jgi:hypothetical protein
VLAVLLVGVAAVLQSVLLRELQQFVVGLVAAVLLFSTGQKDTNHEICMD